MILEKKPLVCDRWVCRGKMQIKRLVVASFAAALLASGVAGPASAAKQKQDGLVNVAIGDIQVKDINIAAAADLVVQACPNLNLDVVLGVISAIDAGDAKQTTFCEVDTGDVRVRQN